MKAAVSPQPVRELGSGLVVSPERCLSGGAIDGALESRRTGRESRWLAAMLGRSPARNG